MMKSCQFFDQTVQHLARSLAHIENTPWDKVIAYILLKSE